MSLTVSPVTLFVGDSFSAEQALKNFLRSVQGKTKGEVSLQVYYLSETLLEEILAQCRTSSFFASAQIFHLKQAEKIKKDQVELLESYLAAPTDASYLIFEASSIEKKNDLVQLIQKKGQVLFLESNEKKEVGLRYIQEKVKRAEKTMAPQVMNRLLEDTGGNLELLETMIERLVVYAAGQPVITLEMFEIFQEDFSEANVFALTDALAGRQTAAGLKVLKQFMDENQRDWMGLLGMLHWQIRRLWQVKVLVEEGAPESLIMKKCKLSPRQIPFIVRQVKGLSRLKLERALEDLFQLDWKMKSGRAEAPIAFEQWLVESTS